MPILSGKMSKTAIQKLIREQRKAIKELKGRGLDHNAIGALVGAGPEYVRRWDEGEKVARGRHRAALLEAASSPQVELPARPEINAQGSLYEDEKKGLLARMRKLKLYPPRTRVRRLNQIIEQSGLSRLQVAKNRLGISRATLYTYLDPSHDGYIAPEVLDQIESFAREVERPRQPNTLQARFEKAAKTLFGPRYSTGFAKREPLMGEVLRKLREVTHYNERSLRRALPPYTAKSEVPSRGLVEAFELAAKELGRIT